MTRIILIRHGQTVWNREQRFRGQADVELDEFGLRQAQATGQYVAVRWPVVAVYASPLQRTTRTAEAIARAQGLDVHPSAGLLDMNFGEWQGQRGDEIAQHSPELFQAWQQTPHTTRFPGGEELADVRKRVTATLDDVVARHAGQAVALVSHNVVIRVLLCVTFGWGNDRYWRLHQETCAVNVFDVEENGDFTIGLINDISHLQKLSED